MERVDLTGIYTPEVMFVIKRDGRHESMQFDKITARIRHLCYGCLKSTGLGEGQSMVDPALIAADTIKAIYSGIETSTLDYISAKVAYNLRFIHPDYGTIASRIYRSNLYKSTPATFSDFCIQISKANDIIDPEILEFVMTNARIIDNAIIPENDELFTYHSLIFLEEAYFCKIYGNKKIKLDRPQYLFMRVAIAIHYDHSPQALDNILHCYRSLSNQNYIHASATLYNASMRNSQLAPCFLLGCKDNTDSILDTIKNCGLISRNGGGIGLHLSNIRSADRPLKRVNGRSSGIIPQIKIYNEIARTFDQGGRRKGSIAIYLEPWHADIMSFLNLKLPSTHESLAAKDLTYGLWVPGLFCKRIEDNGVWSLFSEDNAPGLSDVYDGMLVCKDCRYCVNDAYNAFVEPIVGVKCINHRYTRINAFTNLYNRYESMGLAITTMDPNILLTAICQTQKEIGMPYVCFKDHVNQMSNQSNIGTIKSSNLCTEIMEVSTPDNYATCIIASINLKRFIHHTNNNLIDFDGIHTATREVVRNLNAINDKNHYPVNECNYSVSKHRPIGIGIQGLANVFLALGLVYLSPEAEKLDVAIAEAVYHAALTESNEIAKISGPYPTFAGSPASHGILHFDLWREHHTSATGYPEFREYPILSNRYDWSTLRKSIVDHGLANSLLVAYMPTVSTSQIFNNVESFEPIYATMYTKTTYNGKMTVVLEELMYALNDVGLWNANTSNDIISAAGSIQNIEYIPEKIKEVYKTVWELPQSQLMRRNALRSAFVDQAQSQNIMLRDNSTPILRGVFMLGWKLGMKTGSYYIRTMPAATPMKNNISQTRQARITETCKVGDICENCTG